MNACIALIITSEAVWTALGGMLALFIASLVLMVASRRT